MAKAEALSRHYGVVRAPSKPSASITIPSESSGRPLFSLIGPLRWVYDLSTTSRGARSQLIHPGLRSFEERGRSRAFPLLVWSERLHADQCTASTTATGGPQARITIGRHSRVGKREVSMSR